MSSLGDMRNYQIEQIRDDFIDAREELANKYHFDSERDARLTIFNKCTNVLGSVQVGWAFVIHHLVLPSWWKEKCRIQGDQKAVQNSVNEFQMFLFIGLIHFIFACIESSFRVYLRALDPVACRGGTAEFKSIYACLLIRLHLNQYLPLLDLIRNVRNSLHNNGLFFPTSGKDETVPYKNKFYTFQVGKPNDFVTWDLMLGLMPDIKAMIVDVVESQELSSKASIPEPS